MHVHWGLPTHPSVSMLAHMQSHFAMTSATASPADVASKVRGAAGLLRGLAPKPGQLWSLRHAAATYAAHGWAVVPGAYSVDGRDQSPRPRGGRTSSLAPLPDKWQEAATTDVMQVARWWARHAWVILLPTGGRVEVVELPAELGQATVDRMRERVVPVAVEAGRRWLLFCAAQPEKVSTSDDEWRAGVLLHSAGSWVPVPPIGRSRDRFNWLLSPWACGWRLPHTRDVLAAARG